MIIDGYDLLVMFVLTAFVGFEVISKVPSILHTPLMSGSNAIHGIILVGAMITAGEAHGRLQMCLAFVAVFLATLNIVGGVVVTDRMLDMFKGRQEPEGQRRQGGSGRTGRGQGWPDRAGDQAVIAALTSISADGLTGIYLLSAACFVLALKALSSPRNRSLRQPAWAWPAWSSPLRYLPGS